MIIEIRNCDLHLTVMQYPETLGGGFARIWVGSELVRGWLKDNATGYSPDFNLMVWPPRNGQELTVEVPGGFFRGTAVDVKTNPYSPYAGVWYIRVNARYHGEWTVFTQGTSDVVLWRLCPPVDVLVENGEYDIPIPYNILRAAMAFADVIGGTPRERWHLAQAVLNTVRHSTAVNWPGRREHD